ncbi:MAG: GGDEF domain-containing protein [Trueperaceae bacterium]|nr:GGDEF domain-containing protein [Trueperaceae bacterium]
MNQRITQVNAEIKDALKKAAWLGFSRSMLVGSVLQFALFFLAPAFTGPTHIWRTIFGLTCIVMLLLFFANQRFVSLYRYIYFFLFTTLGLAQLESFLVLRYSSTVAAVAAVNLLAGFGILSIRALLLFVSLTTFGYGYWLWTFNAHQLINTESSIYLMTLAYAFVLHFRFKQNMVQQIKHAKVLEQRSLELEQLHKKYERLSQMDELTDVYNRRYFIQEAERYIALAKRHHLSFSILLFDLDHFKRVNDSKGHLVGDVVLREVARRVKQTLRETDVCARYGGEEFVLLLPFTGLEQALIVSERLRKLISETPISYGQGELWVSSSFGLAVSQEKCTLETMLQRADKALYQAKDRGRNRVEVAFFEAANEASISHFR